MIRFRNILPLLMVVALATTGEAFGSFSLSLVSGPDSATITDNQTGAANKYNDQDNTTNVITVTSSTTPTVPQVGGNLNGISILMTGTTDEPGSGTSAFIVDSTATLKNTTGTAKSITITFTGTAFTDPFGPGGVVNLISSLTYLTGTSSIVSFTSTISDSGGSATTTTLLLNTPLTTDSTSTQFTRSDPTYKIVNEVTVLLAAGGTVIFQARSDVTEATPAPSSAILALAALPIIGLGGLIRRRRQQAEAAIATVA